LLFPTHFFSKKYTEEFQLDSGSARDFFLSARKSKISLFRLKSPTSKLEKCLGIWFTKFINTVLQCTEVRFASFLSGGFTNMVVINPPEKKLAKRTFVQCSLEDLEWWT